LPYSLITKLTKEHKMSETDQSQIMGILPDFEIRRLSRTGLISRMIEPFCYEQVKEHSIKQKVVSYGLSSFGYDIRLADRFIRFTPTGCLDPKNFSNHSDEFWSNEPVTIKRGQYLLAESLERFEIPKDIMGIVVGKSTYARCGLLVNVTPLEPGWKGVLTLELANIAPSDLVVYPQEGIAQVMFFRGRSPAINYETKSGKYQDQDGVQLPLV
jgi:dCTP deaminase